MDLDLGSKVVCNVKVNGQEYKMSAPTVKQTDELNVKSKAKNADELKVYLDFIEDLGMPRKVAENLDVVQLQKLTEGLLGLVKKK